MSLLRKTAYNIFIAWGLWSLLVFAVAGGPALPWWGAVVIGVLLTIAESKEKPDVQN